MTLGIFHDVSMQHLDQVDRETEAAVSEGLIGERDAAWIRSALQLVRADVKHAVERGGQPAALSVAREDVANVSPSSLDGDDTLVLPRDGS